MCRRKARRGDRSVQHGRPFQVQSRPAIPRSMEKLREVGAKTPRLRQATVAHCAIRICSRMREISPAPQTALAQRIGSFAVKLSKMLPLIVDRIR